MGELLELCMEGLSKESPVRKAGCNTTPLSLGGKSN